MQAGDRAAAFEFLQRYESRIRRRIRGKLAANVRRLFDSLDIFSTLGRRLDGCVRSGRLRFRSEGECLSLLFRMADDALVDKARVIRQLEEHEGEDSEFARMIALRLRQAESNAGAGMHIEIDKCMHALNDDTDRRILSLWLTGEHHKEIAVYVRMQPEAVRKRWQLIRTTLRDRFSAVA